MAEKEGKAFGFTGEDHMVVIETQSDHVLVEAQHDNQSYVLEIIQPAKQGTEGIWVIQKVREN